MIADVEQAPEEVVALAERCLTHIRQRFGLALVYENETLSVLDYLVRAVVTEEGGGMAPPPGDSRRAHLVHLLAPSFGAYFGEVLRHTFACRWRLKTDDPPEWLIEFEDVPLRLNPVGAAAEALLEADVGALGGAIATAPEEGEALRLRLEAAPPVPEDEFYAFTTRLEVLQIACDFLRSRLAAREEPLPERLTPEDYDGIFGD